VLRASPLQGSELNQRPPGENGAMGRKDYSEEEPRNKTIYVPQRSCGRMPKELGLAFLVSPPRKQVDTENRPRGVKRPFVESKGRHVQCLPSRVAPETKALIDRADHLRHRSYFVRSRALNIAGWALMLRRESEERRRAHASNQSRKGNKQGDTGGRK
jgi:hypothetical protein